MKSLAIFLASLILCPMFLPMAEAEITSTENVVKEFERNITATDTIPFDEIVNLGDRANATLNPDTWANFLEDYPGNWVGGATRESLISAPGSANGNFTVAGATQFSPQELMGGASEGWVRSPIATNEDSELALQVWHVENPSLATFVPGEFTQEIGQNQTWTTAGNFANDPLQNSLEVGDSSTNIATGWIDDFNPEQSNQYHDTNIDGWDDDYSGNGAIAQASEFNNRTDSDLIVRLAFGECNPPYDIDTEGVPDYFQSANPPTCSDDGAIGHSKQFDGVDDHLRWDMSGGFGTVGELNEEVSEVSIGVWVKPNLVNPYYDKIFMSGDSGVDFGIMDGGPGFIPGTNQLTILHEAFTPTYTNVQIDWIDGFSTLNAEWRHLAFTFNQNGGTDTSAVLKIYIDGILVLTTYPTHNGNQWDLRNSVIARDMLSSGCSGAGCNYWNGHIDELYIFERELNATEIYNVAFNTYSEEEQTFISSYGSIQGVETTAEEVSSIISLYSTYSLPGSTSRPGGSYIPDEYTDGLLHYYPFNEGSGTTAIDYAGNYDLNMYSGGTIYQDEYPQWVDGRHGTGLDFRNDLTDSGANDRRPFRSNPDISLAGTHEITAGAWVYHDPDELPIVEDVFFTYGAPFTNNDVWDNLEGGWYIGADGGNYVFGVVTQDGGLYDETKCLWDPTSNLTAIQLEDNENTENLWLHLALTFENSVLSGYANGNLVVVCPTTYAYLNDPNWASSYTADVISVGAKLQGNEEGDIIIDDFAIWDRAFTTLEMRDFYDNFTALDKYTANINNFQIYGSNTSSEDDMVLLKTLYQGIDYRLNPDAGQHAIEVTFNTIYYPYFFWGANISSNTGDHTAVIHSLSLTFESFKIPYDLVPSPLSKPQLIWEREYHASTDDPDHEYYLDPSGSYGRSYLKFRCPIWPDQDLNNDKTPDSGYLWVFRMDGGNAVNDSYEIFISNSFRGLDHYNTFVSLYDPDIGWFNDTLPASLGMDWVFTEGMNAGIRGYELEYNDNPGIEFWYDHGSEITYDSYTRTDVSEIGPYTTVTVDGTNSFGEWDIDNERWYADNTDSNQPDNNDHYFTFDDDAIYFANNIDHDGFGADKITTCIHLDVNPGSALGSTEVHYNIGWNTGFTSNFVKYDHIVCWGKINGMPSGEVGIKWGDCQTGTCTWYDNRQFIGGWDVSVNFAGGFSELRIPRDIDGDGEDDISHDLAWTLAVLNTNSNYVYDNLPNSNPGGTISFLYVMYCWETSPNVDDVTNWCQKSNGLFQGHNYPNYPAPEVTFMLPYQSTEPTNPYVYAVTYDEDLNYIGDTKCRSGANNVDYIICSGDQSFTSSVPLGIVFDHGWDDPRVFLGARFIQFFVEFNTDDVDIKIWAIDKNSEYDQYKPELFNTFYEMNPDRVEDYIEDNTASVTTNDRKIEYGFSPVFDLVVSDVSYCLITITNPCEIPSLEEVNPLQFTPTPLEVTTQQPKFNHQTTYIYVYGRDSDYSILLQTVGICKNYLDGKFNPYTRYPGAPGTTTTDIVNCAKSSVQTTKVVYNYFAQEYIDPTIQEASDLTSQLTGKIEHKHLIWLAAGYLFPPLAISMWVLEYAVGFSIIDFVSFIVPVIQDAVAKLGELAAELFLFIIFLITCGIIVGSTTLINNALHGEWELINQKTSQSLQGAAGWLASVPYVGGSLQSIGSKAIGGLRK